MGTSFSLRREHSMIELKGLTKSFNGRKILDSIDLILPNQGLFLVQGENGCGKTTLFTILALLDKDYSGSYLYDGKNVASLSGKEIAQIRWNDISYLRQKDNYLPFLSMEENSVLDGFLTEGKAPVCKEKKKLTETSEGESMLALLETYLKPGKRIYLLDEVLDHLDLPNRKAIISKLLDLSKKALVLIVTHDSLLVKEQTGIIRISSGKLLVDAKEKVSSESPLSQPKKTHFSLPLFFRSLKQGIVLQVLYFLLLIFGLGATYTPLEAMTYPYNRMLETAVTTETYLFQVDGVDSSLKDLDKTHVFSGIEALIFSDTLPEDGSVHVQSQKKTGKGLLYRGVGRDYSLDTVVDASLPFDGYFINYQSYLAMARKQQPDFLTLYVKSSSENIIYRKLFGTKALFEASYGLSLSKEITDGSLTYFFQDNQISQDAVPQIHAMDLSAVFPQTMSSTVLSSTEFTAKKTLPKESCLLSDADFQSLTEACLLPDSQILWMTPENKSLLCAYLYQHRLNPWYYQTPLALKSNYLTMTAIRDKSLTEFLLILLFFVAYSLFLAYFYVSNELSFRQAEKNLLYQHGNTKTKVLLYFLLRQFIPVVLAVILGYPLSILMWGAADKTMFAYYPAPTGYCVLLALGILVLQGLCLTLHYFWTEKNKW